MKLLITFLITVSLSTLCMAGFTTPQSISANVNIFQDKINVNYNLINTLGTSWVNGGKITRSLVSPNTKVDIAEARVRFVDNRDAQNPVTREVTFNGVTDLEPIFLTSNFRTVFLFNPSGNLVQRLGLLKPVESRTLVQIGVVGHLTQTVITSVQNLPSPIGFNTISDVADLGLALGVFNVSGNFFSFSSTGNLSIDKSSGESYSYGTAALEQPNKPSLIISEAIQTANIIRAYVLKGGGTFFEAFNVPTVNPNLYNNNGVLTVVPAGKYTIQEYFLSPSGNLVSVQYGDTYYDFKCDALIKVGKQKYNFSNFLERSMLRSDGVTKQGATDGKNKAEIEMFPSPFQGWNRGGGGGLDVDVEHTCAIGSYGYIFVDNNSVVMTVVASPNASQITLNVQEGISSNITFLDGTLAVTSDGVYKVSLTISFSDSNNRTFDGGIGVNGNVPSGNTRWRRKLGAAGDVGDASSSALLRLNNGDTVAAYICADLSDAATIEYMQMIIHRIGPLN